MLLIQQPKVIKKFQYSNLFDLLNKDTRDSLRAKLHKDHFDISEEVTLDKLERSTQFDL